MKLLDICEAIVDCEHKTAPTVEDGEYFVIRTPDIGRGRLKLDQAKKITKETYLSWTQRMVPQPGDLVFAREAPVGNVAIILEGQQICLGQRTVLIRPDKSKVNSVYLCLLLLSNGMQAAILAKSAGSTVPHVNMADIRALDIPQLPDISTQDRFAWILSAYDDLIALNQRRIQLLEESARLLYREWFVKLCFPGYESVAVKDGAPEGWKEQPLEALCDDIRDAVDPSEVEPDSPYLSMEHMPKRSLCLDTWGNAEKVQSTKLKFTQNDILFGKIRPYFHKVGLAFINGITSTDVIVIRAKQSIFLPIVGMVVSSDEFVSHAVATSNGTKMPRADWKVLRKWPVLIPSDELLITFESLVKPIFEQLQTLCFQNRVLKQARDLLLPKLMSGALDVSRIALPDKATV